MQKAKTIANFIEITRINRPIGIILLLTPCLIAIFSSIQNPVTEIFTKGTLFLITLFAIGSVIMRSAGCIINDIFDVKIDKKVARTKNRPLASKEMTMKTAIISLFVLLIIGFLILIQLNNSAIICGITSLFLVILYPLMKRITYYPQIFLGIVFNIGFLIATLEIKQNIVFADLLIYFSLIIITFIYDTIYGFQDIEDDLKIGVKSSSIAISNNPKRILIFSTIFAFLLIFYSGVSNQYSLVFFLLNMFAMFFSIFLIKKCDIKNSQECLKTFKSFSKIGLIIMTSFIFKS